MRPYQPPTHAPPGWPAAAAAGTRTLLGIFVHAAWLKARPDHLDAINQFIEYALSFDDVYLATVKQARPWGRAGPGVGVGGGPLGAGAEGGRG